MKLYNTLSGQEQEFAPAGEKVRMYVCGITPYAPCHMGHAMSYVVFDVLRRYLEFLGYQVDHVQNFTDVDDKIIQRANEEGVDIRELAERNIQEYMESMDALNVLRAQVYPRATQEIPRIIEIIGALIAQGYAYVADGDVYFRVAKVDRYGALSRRTLKGMEAGTRADVDPGKEQPMDFALWKAAKPEEPSWDSPWGAGRPGWHIECTAMSLEYLGETLDIHGGGQDLIFPHHENETAQSEAYTGQSPFVRFWVHNGLLQMDKEKMSKSLGNLVSLRDGLKSFSPDTIRIFFLSSSYRGPMTYSEEGLAATGKALERMLGALEDGPEGTPDSLDSQPYRKRFLEAMDSDLNTPQALAALFDLTREINRAKESGVAVAQSQETLKELGGILGLTFCRSTTARDNGAEPFIELLVNLRSDLRGVAQYALADQIRDRLTELGVVLEDTPQGPRWKYG